MLSWQPLAGRKRATQLEPFCGRGVPIVLIWRWFWNRATGRNIGSFSGHQGGVWSLAFSPDGARLFSAGADGMIRVWDVAGGTEIGATGAAVVVAAKFGDSLGRGARLFRKCDVCHTVTPDGAYKAGPTLYRLFGRRAGAVAGYPYSQTLRTSNVVWTEAAVSQLFSVGPNIFTPGTKMPIQRMPDPRDRNDLIEFLKRVTMSAQQ